MHRTGSLGLFLLCLTGAASIRAGDVVLDNFTIGNLADDTSLTPSNDTFDINETLGQRFADNLFHSFFSFNIDNGETALFSGDPAIQNIISRVTGGSPSTIDGTVESTIDGAGFWFINPAGMIINSTAVFDVSGSLALGAADFVEFVNAERWYAFAPPAGETSTFSVAAPATFGFLDATTAGSLAMSGVTLDEFSAPVIDDIRIAGGTVILDDTRLSTVSNIDDAGDISILGSDISLVGETRLDASTRGTGDAGDIVITGTNSVIAQGNERDSAGDLALRIVSASGDESGLEPPADLGAAGNVTITGGTISLTRAAVLASTSSTRPDNATGSVRIEAPDSEITLRDSEVSSTTFGDSAAGSVIISGGDISLLNRTSVTANTRGTGAAGDITIHGVNSVTANLDAEGNAVGRFSDVFIASTSLTGPFIAEGTSGSAGSVTITGGEIRLAGTRVRGETQSNRQDNVPASIRLESPNGIALIDSIVMATTRGGSDAGSIVIQGADVSLHGDTSVRATTRGTGDAGDIDITGTNSVTAQGNERDSDGELTLLIVSTSGDALGLEPPADLGAAGNVTITGGTISLTRAAVLASTSSTRPDNATGSVRIEAPDSEITLRDSEVSSTTFGDSAAGSVIISGGDISLLNRTSVTANTRGTGAAGDITIHGGNSVTANLNAEGNAVDRFSDVFIASTSVAGPFIAEGTSGSAGSVTITGGEIRLAGTRVRAATASDEQNNVPASIRLESPNGIALIGSIVIATTEGDSDAGSITIQGADVSLHEDTSVRATTRGTGDAGDIFITGTASVTAEGVERDMDGELTLRIVSASGDALGVEPPGDFGAAGNVTITGGTVRLTRTAVLASTSSSQPDNAPGSVRIEAPDNEITLRDSEVSSTTFGDSAAGSVDISGCDVSLFESASVSADSAGAGDAGEITLTANELALVDGASISTSARSTGDAGNIAIDVSGDFTLIGGSSPPSQIATDSRASQGGDIEITTGGRLLARNGSIRASAGELGNGGDIALNAAEIVLQESLILAQADAGNGGKIDINSSIPNQELLLVKDSLSQINADSNTGNAGTITISSPDTDINSAIRTQDVNLFDAPALTADACSPAAWETRSSLIVEDRGGVPPAPDGYLPGSVASAAPHARGTEVESGAHIDAEGGATKVAVASLPVAAGCR